VSRKVNIDEITLPSVSHTPAERVKATINAPGGKVGKDLLDLLQYFESLGSFWCGIRRIYWEESKLEWIPESEEERSRLAVYSVQPSHKVEEEPQPLNLRIVRELVEARSDNEWLVIPLAFWRQGMKDMLEGRYISAIHQFYFVIEGLYAKGQWKGRQVKAQFKRSAQMQQVASDALVFFDKPDQSENRTAIDRYLREEGHDYTADGILDLLVDMRGRLHHFSPKSSLNHAHPLNQQEFRPFGVLLNFFCLRTYPKIVGDRGVC